MHNGISRVQSINKQNHFKYITVICSAQSINPLTPSSWTHHYGWHEANSCSILAASALIPLPTFLAPKASMLMAACKFPTLKPPACPSAHTSTPSVAMLCALGHVRPVHRSMHACNRCNLVTAHMFPTAHIHLRACICIYVTHVPGKTGFMAGFHRANQQLKRRTCIR